jgi:hypothetical protein
MGAPDLTSGVLCPDRAHHLLLPWLVATDISVDNSG